MAARVGLVGVEQHVPHVFAGIDESDEIELVAVAQAGDRADELAEKYGARIYGDHGEMFAQEQLDVAAVCLIPIDQGRVVVDALQAGLHVTADKPLMIEQDKLNETAALVRQNPLLKVGQLFTLRGRPEYAKLHEIVRSGAIGDVVQGFGLRSAMEKRETRAPWFFDERLSGGPIPDLLIHDIDALRWITGLEYTHVLARESNFARPDDPYYRNAGQLFFLQERNATAIMEHHRLVSPAFGGMDCRMKVVGTDGQAEATAKGEVILYNSDHAGPVESLPADRNVFADFALKACSGEEPLVDTASALQSMQAALTARAAADSDTLVAIPRI